MVAMELAKLKILPETGGEIEALFNPNQITIQKTVNWRPRPTQERDVPESQFTHGQPATLSMDLFFDTYETQEDVRKKHTQKIFALTTVEEHGDIHRPPICKLMWGNWEIFQGILEGLNQRFTLFLADGTPVRATLSCTFKEWRSSEEEAKRQDKKSADVAKTRSIRRGDTLSSIAGEEYNDPTLWRPIAEANGIDNPRVLTPGKPLVIPALRPRGGARR
jgi:nucleoid-associated protein YgaU